MKNNEGNLGICYVEDVLKKIGGKWKLIIIKRLSQDTLRYNQLMRSISGITQRMLTKQLRELESDGLIERKIYPVIPPKVEYSLTNAGRKLGPALGELDTWGSKFLKK